MKITSKHLEFLGQKQYPNLSKKLKSSLVHIHDLIPKDSRPYSSSIECEVHNTLQLLKTWRNNLGCSNAFYKKLKICCSRTQNPWRKRLLSKLINARGKK